MSWDAVSRRWWKMHNGKRYVRSCRQLGAPPTKEGSYQVANDWWMAKLAEIEKSRPPHPQAEAIAQLEKRLAYAQRHVPDEVKSITKNLDKIRLVEDPGPIDVNALTHDQATAWRLLGFDMNDERQRRILGDVINRRRWEERLSRDAVASVPTDRTLGGCITGWLDTQRDRMRAGSISPGASENLRRDAERFRDQVGNTIDVGAINEGTVDAYYKHLLSLTGDQKTTGKGMSSDSAKIALRVMRTLGRVDKFQVV